MTDAADRAAIAERRGATYWLLARLVMDPPVASFLAELDRTLSSRSPDATAPLGIEVERLADAVSRACRGDPPAVDLRVEHTRLWSGLSPQYGPPPPYESVLRERRLPGDATTAVAVAYAEADLRPEALDAGPADHIAHELRFLALLCAREAEAWRTNDRPAARSWLAREREFLDDHVLAWVPSHCMQVAGQTRTDYHRAAAVLIARACELDRGDVAMLEDGDGEAP